MLDEVKLWGICPLMAISTVSTGSVITLNYALYNQFVVLSQARALQNVNMKIYCNVLLYDIVSNLTKIYNMLIKISNCDFHII